MSQTARKLCSLLLFAGSVFVVFLRTCVLTINCSLLVTLLLNLAFVMFDLDIGQQ